MKEKKIYVFTHWGLVKGVIVAERMTNHGPQYKLLIDVDRENKGKNYNFWFNPEQLNKYYFTAIVLELFKPFGWFVKSLFKK